MPFGRAASDSAALIQRWLLDIPQSGAQDTVKPPGVDPPECERRHIKSCPCRRGTRDDKQCVPSAIHKAVSRRGRRDEATKVNRGKDALCSRRRHDHCVAHVKCPVGASKRRRSDLSQDTSVQACENVRNNDRSSLSFPHPRPASPSPCSGVASQQCAATSKDTTRPRNAGREHYGRRRRHKTKHNKHDLKTTLESRENSRAKRPEKKLSKKRRKQSGHFLNDDFKAPNIQPDRLTLRAANGPGIFPKGRVSSTLQGRGLPDLTFPELNCLANRRAIESDPNCRASAKKRENGFAEQISQYFSRPSAVNLNKEQSADHDASTPCPTIMARPSYGIACLEKEYTTRSPGRPSRQRLSRPILSNGHNEASAQKQDATLKQPAHIIQDCSHHKSVPGSARSSSSTSYCSWSVTPPRQEQNGKGLAQLTTADSGPQLLDRDHHLHSIRAVDDHQLLKTFSMNPDSSERAPQSSVSRPSLDEYTKSMLAASKKNSRDRFPVQCTTAETYSLADLKHLARLGNLEATEREGHVIPQDRVNQGRSPEKSASRFHRSQAGVSHKQMWTKHTEACTPRSLGAHRHFDPSMSTPPYRTTDSLLAQDLRRSSNSIPVPYGQHSNFSNRHGIVDATLPAQGEVFVADESREHLPIEAESRGTFGLSQPFDDAGQPTFQESRFQDYAEPKAQHCSVTNPMQRSPYACVREAAPASWNGNSVREVMEARAMPYDYDMPPSIQDDGAIIGPPNEANFFQNALSGKWSTGDLQHQSADVLNNHGDDIQDFDAREQTTMNLRDEKDSFRARHGRAVRTGDHQVGSPSSAIEMADFWRPNVLY